MKVNKKWIVVLFLIFLIAAVYQDHSQGVLEQNNIIYREDEHGESKEVQLILNAGELLKEYQYQLEIDPVYVTKEVAEEYFSRTIACIAKDFEDIDSVNGQLPIRENYEDGMVEAEWKFGRVDGIGFEGEILQDEIPEEGIILQIEALLSCGEYEQVHSFSCLIEKKKKSEKEMLLQEIENHITQQLKLEGTDVLELPTEINGISLEWFEKKESLTIQVVLLEIAAVIVLWWGSKKQAKEEEQKRVQELELDYPEIVNQISILLRTGMSTRQIWSKLAYQYQVKRNLKLLEKRPAFEAVVYMSRKLEEGENERVMYQKFADEVNVRCYYRLMRTLSSNLEKGNSGLCLQLEEECRQAYEQKILLAKRLGEEASTKMLIPLMCMMILIMVIVILPAILGTKI